MFASCTTNCWGQMFGFRRYIRLLQRLISSPQGRQQSLSLEINPVDNAEPCYPHDNIVGVHLCDEHKKWILLVVCHMPESMLWLLVQVCWQTIKYLVFQFVPTTSVLEQFVSILVIILPLIQVLHVWIDDHSSKDLTLCKAASLFCFPARSIAQRIFKHVLPCCRTTLLFFVWKFFPTLVTFQFLQQKYVIQTSLYTDQQWFHSVCIHVEYIPNNFFHMGAVFCCCPAIFEPSTYTDKKNNFFFGWTRRHSQFGTFFPSKFQ